MGCGIHMYVEYRPKDEWLNGDYFLIDNPEAEDSRKRHVDLYGDRNYPLFAVLADVRNGDYVECMEYPKGIPSDVTNYVKHEYERWGMDAHSSSYFTLQEIIDFHNEYKPCDHVGNYILRPLIDRLKQRADELDLIWDFEWDRRQDTQALRDKAGRIRIVFWFDN